MGNIVWCFTLQGVAMFCFFFTKSCQSSTSYSRCRTYVQPCKIMILFLTSFYVLQFFEYRFQLAFINSKSRVPLFSVCLCVYLLVLFYLCFDFKNATRHFVKMMRCVWGIFPVNYYACSGAAIHPNMEDALVFGVPLYTFNTLRVFL